MKKILILILTIICSLPSFVFSGSSRKTVPYAEIFCEVRNKAAVHLAKKYNMQLIGVGEGLMHNINLMGLSFSIDRQLSKNEARFLLVQATQDLLDEINKNDDIRKYLVVYPFDPAHVSITIYIKPSNIDRLYHPELAVFSASHGENSYSTNNPENEYKYKTREYEPFEDAVKILNGEIPAPPSEIK